MIKNKTFFGFWIFLLILIFSVESSYAQITSAEYFWDIDPGNGNGVSLTAVDGNLDEAIESVFSNGVNQPAVGIHTFNVRVKDAKNFWGPVFTKVVNIESTIISTDKKIIQAEYFWDTDPGNGNGTAILALDGNLDEAIETIFSTAVSQPTVGIHTFNIRVKDVGNFWGPTFSQVLNIENTIVATDKKIIQAQYFWDNDPGNGNGTAILALDGNLDAAIETVFSNAAIQPAVGLHTFNIRVKDFGNFWGPTFTRVVNIESSIVEVDKKVIQAEYFWDTDPGNGNGVPILALDGNLDAAIETVFNSAVSEPIVGLHTFNIRVKDFGDFWGPTFTRVINVENTIVETDKKVIQAECFWDSDPGVGNGFTILALDGNLDGAIEKLMSSDVPTLGLTLGAHVFNIRVKDQNNFWSPLFKHVVEVTDCIAPLVNLGTDKTICDGQSISIDASNHFESYLWSTGETTQMINVTMPGTYYVAATDTVGCIRRDTIVISPQQHVHLGNDTTICSMSNFVINAGSYESYLWSNTQTSPSINISTGTSSDFSVTVTDVNGCLSTDTIHIDVFSLPVVNLGNDTAMCVGSALTLDAGPFASYLWTGGSTAQNLVVSNSNTYSVTVTDNNSCENTDQILVTFHALPIPNLGPDRVVCDGSPLTLNPGVYSSYLWSDMSSNPTLIVNAPGTYFVKVTNSYGCSGTDTIVISPQQHVHLGNDTTICSMSNFVINAGSYESYLWSNTQTSPSINISTGTSSNYSVTVTDASGCTSADTIQIDVFSLPVVNLGNDTAMCVGSTLTLDAGTFASYLWAGGSTAQNLVVSNSNTYSVTVTDNNSCENTDQIMVTFHALPIPNLGPDRVVCDGSPLTLNPGVYSSYLWSDMSSNPTLTVNAPGTYFVKVTNSYGCSGTDTIVVSSQQHVHLGNDTTICSMSNFVINAGSYESYLWSNTQTSPSINISTGTSSNYSVTVTDVNGCLSADTIHIDVFSLPVVNLGNDTAMCVGSTLTLDAGTFASYLWTGGSTAQNLVVSNSNTYSVTVTDSNSCENTDQILVTFHALPILNLGPDKTICDGSPLTLNPGVYSSYLWSDMSSNPILIVNTPGTYFVKVTNSYGCFGTDTIHISASSTVTSAYSHSICQGDSYFFNGNNITTAGVYYKTHTSAAGCDSIVELTLSILPLPVISLGNDTTLCQWENIILDAGSHDSYSWTNSSTSQQVNIDTTGYGLGTHTIGVTVTDNGCAASDQIEITFTFCVGIDEVDESYFVDLYPNPSNGNVFIQLNNIQSPEKIKLRLFNPAGQLIQTWERTISPRVPESIDFSNAARGVYFLQVSGSQKNSFHKLIYN